MEALYEYQDEDDFLPCRLLSHGRKVKGSSNQGPVLAVYHPTQKKMLLTANLDYGIVGSVCLRMPKEASSSPELGELTGDVEVTGWQLEASDDTVTGRLPKY